MQSKSRHYGWCDGENQFRYAPTSWLYSESRPMRFGNYNDQRDVKGQDHTDWYAQRTQIEAAC
jgi:hypothetical protein